MKIVFMKHFFDKNEQERVAEIRRRPPPYYGKSVPELKFNVSNASFV